MHQLIVHLKNLLPCRVLGDDLQGIFGFRDDPLIGWPGVQAEFANDLGTLETPHRWINTDNERLGRWLLRERPAFRQDREPDYHSSPVERRRISYADLGKELLRLTDEKEGRICIIRPKARRLHPGTETTLVRRGYRVLEPNDLTTLRNLILALSDETPSRKSDAAMTFFEEAHGGLPSDDKSFIRKILSGDHQRPRRTDRNGMCVTHTEGTTPELISDLLDYVERIGRVSCKLRESVSGLKSILEEHIESGVDLKSLYTDEIAKRKYQSRGGVYRCIGSTLLVKGLEFGHAVILRGPNWQRNWGNHRDLYVALTRGSKSVSLIDLAA